MKLDTLLKDDWFGLTPSERDFFSAMPLWRNPLEFKTQTIKTGDTVRFHEEVDVWRVEVDLPGVAKEDLKVDVVERARNRVSVYIEGKRNVHTRAGKSEETLTREFTLNNVDETTVDAFLENGLLTVTAHKRKDNNAGSQRRQLEIK